MNLIKYYSSLSVSENPKDLNRDLLSAGITKKLLEKYKPKRRLVPKEDRRNLKERNRVA